MATDSISDSVCIASRVALQTTTIIGLPLQTHAHTHTDAHSHIRKDSFRPSLFGYVPFLHCYLITCSLSYSLSRVLFEIMPSDV